MQAQTSQITNYFFRRSFYFRVYFCFWFCCSRLLIILAWSSLLILFSVLIASYFYLNSCISFCCLFRKSSSLWFVASFSISIWVLMCLIICVFLSTPNLCTVFFLQLIDSLQSFHNLLFLWLFLNYILFQ